MYLLIDNYDSFTYNLRHYLGELGAEVDVWRNDTLTADDALGLRPQGIVISPGPCDPHRAGICVELVRKAAGLIPVLGVCLGHQCIGQVFGGLIVRAPVPMHGKASQISHNGDGILTGVPSPFLATRYHSLTVAPEGFPNVLRITARSEDGVIQGCEHVQHPIFGVQFHPESIASEHGHTILRNFLNVATTGRIAA